MKILVVQSIPYVLELVRERLDKAFPQLRECFLYESGFEKSLQLVTAGEDLVAITSDFFHDQDNVLFSREEKNSNRLAQEIKKINPKARVYAFSSYQPLSVEYLDGFFRKSSGGDNTLEEITQIVRELGLV